MIYEESAREQEIMQGVENGEKEAREGGFMVGYLYGDESVAEEEI